jgi:hypothetical protein
MEVSLLESPGLVDLILILVGVEAAALIVWHRWTGHGLSLGEVGRMLPPGICLMVALRAALAGEAWPFVPLALAAALIAHVVDLRGRLKRR